MIKATMITDILNPPYIPIKCPPKKEEVPGALFKFNKSAESIYTYYILNGEVVFNHISDITPYLNAKEGETVIRPLRDAMSAWTPVLDGSVCMFLMRRREKSHVAQYVGQEVILFLYEHHILCCGSSYWHDAFEPIL